MAADEHDGVCALDAPIGFSETGDKSAFEQLRIAKRERVFPIYLRSGKSLKLGLVFSHSVALAVGVVEEKVATCNCRLDPKGVDVGRTALAEVDVLEGVEEIGGRGEAGRNDGEGEGVVEWLYGGTLIPLP